MARLQKQLAFERFLARLLKDGPEDWVLKGGYAIELRLGHLGRATKDLDLTFVSPSQSSLFDRIQSAAERVLGDYFTFVVARPGSSRELRGPPLGGFRFSVEARMDGRRFHRFPLDVGQGDVTIRTPDLLQGRSDLSFAGVQPVLIPVYPVEDHFAEKVHAYTTPRNQPTRVKDLVDLMLLIDLGLQPTQQLRTSILATFERYNRHPLPERLPAPPKEWKKPFWSLATEAGLSMLDLDDAYAQVAVFVRKLDL